MNVLKSLHAQLIALHFMNGWQNFKVHCNIPMTQKFKATLSKKEDDRRTEDDQKNEDDDLKN